MTRNAAEQQACAAFGAALQAERERQGMSQADLSKASGLHRTTIAGIEHGQRDPRFDTLMALRRGLRSLAEVFARAEDEQRV